jgi:protein-arginine kinase activator protein McsA
VRRALFRCRRDPGKDFEDLADLLVVSGRFSETRSWNKDAVAAQEFEKAAASRDSVDRLRTKRENLIRGA